MGTALFEDPVFLSFASKRPVATGAQLVLRRMLAPDVIDQLFRENAELQFERLLLFSTVTKLMTSVVFGQHKSVNAASKKMAEELGVSVTSVYSKLNCIEPQTTQALVRHSYRETVAACQQIGGVIRNDVSGYATRILDGNHHPGTEHRLKETRGITAAPLPGKSLVVFDPRHDAVCDVFPIEDGHAQELSALDEVIDTIGRKQLWVGDRNFCVLRFLYRIAGMSSCFVIRQHGKLKGTVHGAERLVAHTETGDVFENELELPVHNGRTLTVRRVVVKLQKPTRKGETEIVLLTNLPSEKADGQRVAELYRDRWRIETAFLHLTISLNSEIRTLCYPSAALFCFALALVAYNAMSILKSAVVHQFGREACGRLSHYYLASEIGSTTEGLLIALPESRWECVNDLPVATFTERLLEVTSSMDMQQYRKSVRGPKKPPPKKTGNKRTVHVSTKQLLDQRTYQ